MRILHVFLQFSVIGALCFVMQTESFLMPAAAGGAGMGSAAATAIGMGGIAASVMGPFQLLLLTKLSLGLGTAASFLSQALIENFKLRKESDEGDVSKFPFFGRKGSDESDEFPLLKLFHKKGSYESDEGSSEKKYKKSRKHEKSSSSSSEEKKSVRKRRHHSSEETKFPFFPYLKYLKSHLSKFHSYEDSDEYSTEDDYKRDYKGEYRDHGDSYDKKSSSHDDNEEVKEDSYKPKSHSKDYRDSHYKDSSEEVSVFGLLEKKLHLARTLIAGSGEHQTVYLVKKKYDEYDGDSVYEAHIDGSKVKFVKPKGYEGGYSYEGKTISPQSDDDYHSSSSDSHDEENYQRESEREDGKYIGSSDKHGGSKNDQMEYNGDAIHDRSHGGSSSLHSSSSHEYKKSNGNNYKLIYYADKSSEEYDSYERKYHDLTKAIRDAVKSHHDSPKTSYSKRRSNSHETQPDTHKEHSDDHQTEEYDTVHEEESESHKVAELNELTDKDGDDSLKEKEDAGPVARPIDAQLRYRSPVIHRERFRFPGRQSRSRSIRRDSDESERFVDYPEYDSFQVRADYNYDDGRRFDSHAIVGVPLPAVRGIGTFRNRGRMLSRIDNFDYDDGKVMINKGFGVRLPGSKLPSNIEKGDNVGGVGVPLPHSETRTNLKSRGRVGVSLPRLGKELYHQNGGSESELGVSFPRVEIDSEFKDDKIGAEIGVSLLQDKENPTYRGVDSVLEAGVPLPRVESDSDKEDKQREETGVRRLHFETQTKAIDQNSVRGIDVPINFHISVGGFDPNSKSTDDIENEDLDPVDAAKKLTFKLEDIKPNKRGLWTEYSSERKQLSFFLSAEDKEDKISSRSGAASDDLDGHQKKTKINDSFNLKPKPHQINEEYIYEKIKKSDPSDCNEKLLCDLGTKSTTNPTELKKDEMAILTQVAFSPSDEEISEAHSVYEIALAKGFSGSDCKLLYPKCMFSGEQLMRFIRILDKKMGDKTVEEIEDLLLK